VEPLSEATVIAVEASGQCPLSLRMVGMATMVVMTIHRVGMKQCERGLLVSLGWL